MAEPDESQLVAVLLPAPEAPDAIGRIWDRGDAVVVMDRRHPDLDRRLAGLSPTRLLDSDGEHVRPGGRGVPTGVGAVVTTSGTTGRPRQVMLDHTALAASAARVSAALDIDPARDRWLACLSLHHVAGLAIVARAHHTGTPLTVHAGFDPGHIAGALDCTVVSLVPTTLHRLLDHRPDAAARFRRVLIGGGPVPGDLRARAEAAEVHVTTTYGLTETGGGCVHDGHPLPDVEIALEPGTDEILVRGPVVMRGYRADAAETDAEPGPWRAGWLATGDTGAWAADGRFTVVDRRADLVITGGVNVSPTAVEARLAGAPGVADVAVIGLADPEWGERVVACVVAGISTPTLDDLRAYGVDAGLSAAELPRELRLVAEIPRSPGGKILRRVLRA